MNEILKFIEESKSIFYGFEKNKVITYLVNLSEEEVVSLITKIESLKDNVENINGKYITADKPHEIFTNAMNYKSDSNPFTECGELTVNNPFEHLNGSITNYLEMTMDELDLDL